MRKPLAATLGAFVFLGIFWGSFAVLLTDLSRSLSLSPGPLGLALFAGAASSIVAMALLGRTVDRIGRRPFVLASGMVLGLGTVGLAAAEGYGTLIAALVILYAASGIYDVGINASAVDLERASGRRIMSYFHAAFSGGGAAGALAAGALLSSGVGYRQVYLLVLLPLLVALLGVAMARPVAYGAAARDVDGGEAGRGLYTNLPLLLVASIATLGLLSEGEMEHWSGIYLRDGLALPVFLGASGVAVFHAAMTLGRLAAAWTVNRMGNRRSLALSGLLTAAGMTLSLATREPLLVVLGFLVVGVALSAVVPIAFSVAGDLAPARAGAAISVVTTLGYGGFLLGPVMVGGLAEVFGLRIALGTIAVAGLSILVLSSRVGAERKTRYRQSA